jgi:Ca2+-binding RTX toxin-like protein
MVSTGDFKVEIGGTQETAGTQVFTATDSTLGFASYAPVVIDVSAFAGGTHLLRFEAISSASGTGPLDSYDVDAISLDNPPSAPSTPAQRCNGQLATIAGTSGNDILVGTTHRDVVASLGGNDRVSGLAGNDLICGGAGKDKLRGGKGKDKLLGQKGRDTLRGGGGKDLCKGGKGKDSAACEKERSI